MHDCCSISIAPSGEFILNDLTKAYDSASQTSLVVQDPELRKEDEQVRLKTLFIFDETLPRRRVIPTVPGHQTTISLETVKADFKLIWTPAFIDTRKVDTSLRSHLQAYARGQGFEGLVLKHKKRSASERTEHSPVGITINESSKVCIIHCVINSTPYAQESKAVDLQTGDAWVVSHANIRSSSSFADEDIPRHTADCYNSQENILSFELYQGFQEDGQFTIFLKPYPFHNLATWSAMPDNKANLQDWMRIFRIDMLHALDFLESENIMHHNICNLQGRYICWKNQGKDIVSAGRLGLALAASADGVNMSPYSEENGWRYYFAPEVNTTARKVYMSSDIYSLGILFVEFDVNNGSGVAQQRNICCPRERGTGSEFEPLPPGKGRAAVMCQRQDEHPRISRGS
ncbi:hypothetical protein B0T24DRAFT_591505 [Lasiosphaeria ovina]|uniref:Protein kinase domain-containing protein n=1 Tax=Lasiosphaeria ovina TaxID=92902 RepID=A0AAE0KFL5_9PEZI|nr:hypothetical protein B0T24DRAFT_591505 [Lasiosphaeria ovina]